MVVRRKTDVVVLVTSAVLLVITVAMVHRIGRFPSDSAANRHPDQRAFTENSSAPRLDQSLVRGVDRQANNFNVLSADERLRSAFADRKSLLRQHCTQRFGAGALKLRNLRQQKSTRSRKHIYRHFFVDHLHQVVFCASPKVASTTWRRYFTAIISSNSSYWQQPEMIDQEQIHKDKTLLIPLYKYNPSKIAAIIRNYAKITFVRNPLDRLYSAWASKLAKSSYFYPQGYGSFIIKQYRSTATEADIKLGYPVYLQEFLQFYLRYTKHRDGHWESQRINCDLCDFPFDFIGHFENVVEEADYLIRHVIKPKRDWVKFPRAGSSGSLTVDMAVRDKNMTDLIKVSKELFLKAADDLKSDFQLLGYDFNKTLNYYTKYLASPNN